MTRLGSSNAHLRRPVPRFRAAKLHPAAERLIAAAAQMSAEPIPLFLFAEGREKLVEGLDVLLADRGLERAVSRWSKPKLSRTSAIPASRQRPLLLRHRHGTLAAYATAWPLFARALAIREKALCPSIPRS